MTGTYEIEFHQKLRWEITNIKTAIAINTKLVKLTNTKQKTNFSNLFLGEYLFAMENNQNTTP